MIGIRKSIIVLILLILVVFTFTYYTRIDRSISNTTLVGANNSTNDTSGLVNKTDYIANVSEINSNDGNLVLPPKEAILNSVNWSNYPLLRNPYIYNYEISDPTFIIDHKFLYVTICADATDVSNETEVLKEISGVTIEMKKVLGTDSAPNVWVTVDGVLYYSNIKPYETEVWAKAFH